MKQGLSLHNFLKKQYQTTHFSVEKENKMTWKRVRALKGEKPWICSLKKLHEDQPCGVDWWQGILSSRRKKEKAA